MLIKSKFVLSGCRLTFNQVYESEAHYRAVHTNSCSVCRKSLPSNHLLDLHIQAFVNIDSLELYYLLFPQKKYLPSKDTRILKLFSFIFFSISPLNILCQKRDKNL